MFKELMGGMRHQLWGGMGTPGGPPRPLVDTLQHLRSGTFNFTN